MRELSDIVYFDKLSEMVSYPKKVVKQIKGIKQIKGGG